jgi:hypothetical protein
MGRRQTAAEINRESTIRVACGLWDLRVLMKRLTMERVTSQVETSACGLRRFLKRQPITEHPSKRSGSPSEYILHCDTWARVGYAGDHPAYLVGLLMLCIPNRQQAASMAVVLPMALGNGNCTQPASSSHAL